MKYVMRLLKERTTWLFVSGILVAFGFGQFAPLVPVLESQVTKSVEVYCKSNPLLEECNDIEFGVETNRTNPSALSGAPLAEADKEE